MKTSAIFSALLITTGLIATACVADPHAVEEDAAELVGDAPEAAPADEEASAQDGRSPAPAPCGEMAGLEEEGPAFEANLDAPTMSLGEGVPVSARIDPPSQAAVASSEPDGAAPDWCNGQACVICNRQDWTFCGAQVNKNTQWHGKKVWNATGWYCYCEGTAYYWNYCC